MIASMRVTFFASVVYCHVIRAVKGIDANKYQLVLLELDTSYTLCANMIVQVQQGQLKGIENKAVLSGKVYYSFLGIPFAEPPVGDLRFKPPQSPKKWEGIRSAEKTSEDCFQMNFVNHAPVSQYKGSEDCLYLNVHIPQLPSDVNTPKPVMVFIHGGAYQFGSGAPSHHAPDFLVDYDIVIVTVNYRLNIFGFLNMGTSNCPGNAGLKDQTMALRWIKENISSFGGDAANITLFGNSAGATAAYLHTLSPLSKGLFNRVVLLSPVMLLPEPEKRDPTEKGFKVGEVLGFKGTSAYELVEFLKNKTPAELHDAMNAVKRALKEELPGSCTAGVLFAPSIEPIKQNAFLSDSVINLIKNAEPIPCLVGMNNIEGTLAAFMFPPEAMQKLSNDLSMVIKSNFKCQSGKLQEVAARVKEFYFADKQRGAETMNEFLALYTDIYFLNFYKIFDHIMRSDLPLYLYFFTLDGQFNAAKRMRMPTAKGAGHGDEILYIFYRKVLFEGMPIEDSERRAIKNFCSRLTNFARNGDPNSPAPNSAAAWKPCTVQQPCYLEINEEVQLRSGKILQERRAFWESVAHLICDNADL